MAVDDQRQECPGPLVWFNVEPEPDGQKSAVLECGTCGHITVTGNWNEPAHSLTPVLTGS